MIITDLRRENPEDGLQL